MGKEEGMAGRIKKGTTIQRTKPFTFVLSSKHLSSLCDNCFKSGKLFKCSACQYVSYCGRNCQKESWSMHKFECSNLKRISPRILPDTARLMARIIIKLSQGGGDQVGYYTETNFRKFKDLMSHYSDIKKHEKRMEHFTCLCGILCQYLTDVPLPNTAELLGIYGRICINSFNILDSSMNSVGVGIYLGPSVIDHSCKPNAVAVFEGTTIIVRTIDDLPSLDWSQVKISYIDVLRTTRDRREELKDSYYFLCDCKKCQEPTPEEDAAACQNKSCSYPCVFDVDQCPSCATKFPKDFRETFTEIMELTTHHLQNMKNTPYLDVSKVCMRKQEGVLHPLNVHHVRTIEAAFDAALNLQAWEEAEIYGQKLLPGYSFYCGTVHPSTGILYLMMGKIQLHLEKPKEALDSLRKAKAVLEVTHGETHFVMRETLSPMLLQASMEAALK